eukprot:2314526-Prymnesium_polylepis.1
MTTNTHYTTVPKRAQNGQFAQEPKVYDLRGLDDIDLNFLALDLKQGMSVEEGLEEVAALNALQDVS